MINKIIAMLRKLFKKNNTPSVPKTEPPKIEPETSSLPKVNSKKIAIIIGHGHGDSGAESWDEKRNEFEYSSIVANYLFNNVKNHEIRLFWRDYRGISGVNSDVGRWDDDLSIELHCNSADSSSANGCEILCLGSDKEAIKLGQDLATKFCKHFNRKIRDTDGVKELKRSDRGHYSLALVDDGKPSILVEPFFISNPNEWIEPLVYAEFLADWINKQ